MKVANAASLCEISPSCSASRYALSLSLTLSLPALMRPSCTPDSAGLIGPDVGLVPVLRQELLLRLVDDVGLDGGEVGELRAWRRRRQPRLRRLPQVLGAVGQRFADEVAVDVPAAIEAPLRRDVAVRREHGRSCSRPSSCPRRRRGRPWTGAPRARSRGARSGRRRSAATRATAATRCRAPAPRRSASRRRRRRRSSASDARLRVVGVHLVGAQRVDHPDEDVIERAAARRPARAAL